MTAADSAAERAARSFYDRAIDEADAIGPCDLPGVEAELALLRKRLHELVHERPVDHELMLKSVEMIVRTVAARYRMSPKRVEELDASMAASVAQIFESLTPVKFRDV